jgi:hypothetical protein
MVMMSVGRLLLAIQFLTCLSLTPTSPAKTALFHGSPCLSDPSGRVPRRKCQSSKSPKLNPVGGSSTSVEGIASPFPKISENFNQAEDHFASFGVHCGLAQPGEVAANHRRSHHEETANVYIRQQ